MSSSWVGETHRPLRFAAVQDYYEELWERLPPDLSPPDFELRRRFLLAEARSRRPGARPRLRRRRVHRRARRGRRAARSAPRSREAALSRARGRHPEPRLSARADRRAAAVSRRRVRPGLGSEVIEHVADTARWLSEVRRVLAPGGRLLLTTPTHGRARLALGGVERFSEPARRSPAPVLQALAARLLDEFGFDEVVSPHGRRPAAAAPAAAGPGSPLTVRVLLDTTYARRAPVLGTAVYLRTAGRRRSRGAGRRRARSRSPTAGAGARAEADWAACATCWRDGGGSRSSCRGWRGPQRADVIHHPLPAHAHGDPAAAGHHRPRPRLRAAARTISTRPSGATPTSRTAPPPAAPDAVMCVSETTAGDVRELWGVPARPDRRRPPRPRPGAAAPSPLARRAPGTSSTSATTSRARTWPTLLEAYARYRQTSRQPARPGAGRLGSSRRSPPRACAREHRSSARAAGASCTPARWRSSTRRCTRASD